MTAGTLTKDLVREAWTIYRWGESWDLTRLALIYLNGNGEQRYEVAGELCDEINRMRAKIPPGARCVDAP